MASQTAVVTTTTTTTEPPKKGVLSVAIEEIHPNRFQPRKTFDDATLAELAESIKQHGLMQPILVRKRPNGFEIIAGERRWRACQQAGLKAIEVIVKDLADTEVFEWALIENIQREDLTALEEAQALHRLIEEFDLSQQQAADAVGRSRAAVANLLSLLELP